MPWVSPAPAAGACLAGARDGLRFRDRIVVLSCGVRVVTPVVASTVAGGRAAGRHPSQTIPMPERRLMIHVRSDVEIGVSDGATQICRSGDARLMEDTCGRGHTHCDLSPVIQTVVVLKD
jgi:hypothetical protein